MSIKMQVVRVKQVPAGLNAKQSRAFLEEIKDSLDDGRPHLVLDCSNLPQIDRSYVLLFLGCLEEVMKCNGDVKLAALPPGAGGVLEMAGIDHLFDIYRATPEAVNSFHQFSGGMFPYSSEFVSSQQESGSAA